MQWLRMAEWENQAASSLLLHFQFMNYISIPLAGGANYTSNAKVFISSFLALQFFKVTVSTVHMIFLRCEVREAKLVKQLVNSVAVS